MRIHPKFEMLIGALCGVANSTTVKAYMDDFVAAGKPVVEEEHTVEDALIHQQRERIKELEAKLAQATWENLGDQRKMDLRNEARNAALEEAAKEADAWTEAPVQHWPSWLQDSNEAATMHLIEVTRTNFKRFAARIRALKKETK